MRKCVSMVAVASAAVGLAACSAPGQRRVPAGAVQPLSGQAAAGARDASRAGHRHAVAPVAAAAAAASAAVPAVPAASGAVPAKPGPGGRNPQAGAGARHDPAAAPGAAALVPSGTTGAAGQAPDAAPHPHTDSAPSGAAAAARARKPAPAFPRPAPPPPAEEQNAPDANLGYDPNAAASEQIVEAVAAARMDGKAVLLDFGADWCTACKALDKAMHTPKVRAVLARSYHVVQIDLGNGDPQHMQLATQFAAYGTFGMPLLVVLNPDGTVRADSALTGQPKYTEADMAAWLTQGGPR